MGAFSNTWRLSAFTVAVALAGCTSTPDWPSGGALDQSHGLVASVDPQVTVHRKTSDAWDSRALPHEQVPALMRDLLLSASLSDAVYRREFGNDPVKRRESACSYVSGSDERPAPNPLPDRWVRVTARHLKAWGVSLGEKSLCLSGKGLAYELYARVDDTGRAEELVLAFRGTENDKDQFIPDWASNFSQLDFGRNDDASFRGAREVAVAVVGAFGQILPATAATAICSKGQAAPRQLPISFVGHSLGGGLAQHAAYAVSPCDATRAVTFNTSPVTGWFFLSKNNLIKNADPIIVRAYNDGEVLAYLRNLTIRFNFARENRIDYQLAFREFTSQRHSMASLAYWIGRRTGMGGGQVAGSSPALLQR